MKQDSNRVILCINIALGACVLSVFSSLFLVIILNIIATNGGIFDWIANLSDTLETITGGLSIITSIVFFIIFIIWLRSVYGNLYNKTGKLRFSVGWSVGGWFVPIWNFFRPYQVVKDLFVRTNDYLALKEDNKIKLSLLAVDLWWALAIISIFFDRLSYQSARMTNPDTGEGFFASAAMQLISGMINIAFYISAKRLLREYLKAEPDLE